MRRVQKWWTNITTSLLPPLRFGARSFRSDAVLEALAKASQDRVPNLILYNYPSFSGAFSALFAHLFHSHLNLPCLTLPFSSIIPLRVEDLCIEGLQRCYLLDFLGPKGFAMELLNRTSCKVIGFDHRQSVLQLIPFDEICPENLTFRVNVEKSSSISVYEYFSSKLGNIEDSDLLEINAVDLIAKGNSYISARESAANNLMDKVFKVRLGRGFYGECLGVRADWNTDLADEIGKQLSVRSAIAGLRPIGAVVYMQRNNLKMCLRSTDNAVDTSEIAKAYGGGGSSASSSFMIRMDEYNLWLSTNSS